MIKVQDDLAAGTRAKGGCLSPMTPGFKEASPPTYFGGRAPDKRGSGSGAPFPFLDSWFTPTLPFAPPLFQFGLISKHSDVLSLLAHGLKGGIDIQL